MRIVIAGATDLGRAAAQQLIEAGHEVVVVDSDRAALEALSDSHDCGLVAGDATLPSTLREAAGDRPDALLALTASDENNVLAAVVGRSIGFARVIPQIIKAELCAICDELELTDLVTPHETVAARLTDLLSDTDDTEHEAHLSGELRLASVEIGPHMAGTKLGDLPLTSRARAVALRRGDAEMLAEDSATLSEGDTLVIVVKRSEAGDVLEDLKSERTR